MMPATITKIFGKSHGTTIYGITFTGFTLSAWFAFFAVANIEDSIGWGNLFWIFTGIQLVALLTTFWTKFEIDWVRRYSKTSSSGGF